MVWQPDSEKSLSTCNLAVSTEYRRVTDGHLYSSVRAMHTYRAIKFKPTTRSAVADTARCFVSLNISLSYSRSFEVTPY